ncbi:MAG: creatininase family protein, partial [Candidatus Bipolaricaulota bacterium]
MILERESWPEVEEFLKDNSIAIVPIGSTEQHGPHGS